MLHRFTYNGNGIYTHDTVRVDEETETNYRCGNTIIKKDSINVFNDYIFVCHKYSDIVDFLAAAIAEEGAGKCIAVSKEDKEICQKNINKLTNDIKKYFRTRRY